ncbi:hypothetical protein JKF63_02711 [Porcisia hertigi]|uniref:Transmembrane protein n=1 Tax=Porcisia hertigi TaxID=2761500 RepID=A0A836HP52_9TRYP|nr:hypothetical protein JKF63_02711 [Porcisia hertigi]
MSDNHEGSSRGLRRSPCGASTEHLRSSQESRASEASTGTNMSGGSGSTTSRSSGRAITFATADRGVISVALSDLSSALGIRRADVVSQRLMFQAHSAPSYRTGCSLLGGALGTSGGAGLCASSATATSPSAVTTESHHPSDSLSTTPPLTQRPGHYQRRQSTLRATQVDFDTSMLPARTGRQSHPPLLPPPPPPPLTSPSLPDGTPPPGGISTRCRALAAPSGVEAAFAGGVSLLLRRSSADAAPWQGQSTERRSPVEDEGVPELGDDSPLLSATVSSQEHRNRAACGPYSTPTSSARRSGDSAMRARPATDEKNERSQYQHHSVEEPDPPSRARSASSRRVHFSEDVIESVHVARPENEYMRLVVVYSRPWYAYVLLVLFGVLLGLSHASVMYLEEDQVGLKDRALSVTFVLFLVVGMGAAVLAAHLLLCWRPDSEEEQSFFEDAGQRERLPQLWSFGALFVSGSVAAIVFSRFISSTVAGFMAVSLACHLILEHLNRSDSGDTVTHWDALGCVTTSLGVVLMGLGGVLQEMVVHRHSPSVTLLSLLGWGLSVVISGVCWTFFVRQLRDMSQRVSQHFLLSTSLVVSTLTLGIGAYIMNMVLASDEANSGRGSGVDARASAAAKWNNVHVLWDGALLPCYRFFPDVVVLLGGGLCSLLCWYAYHAVSFYVDHAASAACMVLGAVLSTLPLIVARVLPIVWANATASAVLLWSLALTGIGVAVAEAGAAMVVWSGFRHRRETEIRIVLE